MQKNHVRACVCEIFFVILRRFLCAHAYLRIMRVHIKGINNT